MIEFNIPAWVYWAALIALWYTAAALAVRHNAFDDWHETDRNLVRTATWVFSPVVACAIALLGGIEFVCAAVGYVGTWFARRVLTAPKHRQ